MAYAHRVAPDRSKAPVVDSQEPALDTRHRLKKKHPESQYPARSTGTGRSARVASAKPSPQGLASGRNTHAAAAAAIAAARAGANRGTNVATLAR